jgi:hypothetical protein
VAFGLPRPHLLVAICRQDFKLQRGTSVRTASNPPMSVIAANRSDAHQKCGPRDSPSSCDYFQISLFLDKVKTV